MASSRFQIQSPITSTESVAIRVPPGIALRTPAYAMDRHEKGLERVPGRMDAPLPDWNGSYGGDSRRLPKAVQKLLMNRPLSAEEKAELLWRFFELDQRARVRAARTRTAFLTIGFALVAFYLALYQRAWIVERVMAWLSPPAAPHA